ncbi:MAG: transcription termination/antitermination protein NusG [Alphaproteobacteria bacterium CG_4_10_14_0_2_um_filter_63_37]|nr:MAG: transcription termination/antitermination factor NusG [Proteobacteria bacterium CG1_02_64_396]PJA23636.1 MAG: transcription termination/antitermination protein NusG [Alphaproteobacteria bacterium CG_4_10_14_0_2_um_filter_63_37]
MAKQWYVVHTYSTFERKVRDNILERAKWEGMEDQFGEILVPVEKVEEVRKGVKKTSERMFFPGYILVEMELNDASWHLVKSVPRVTGFLGGSDRPQPLTKRELDRIVQQIEEGKEKPRPKINFDVGESVRVIDGPFANFSGVVEQISPEKGKVKVAVSIFGRPTPVELDFGQVEKS